jgi:CBS domain containing-hemolysin-like protein
MEAPERFQASAHLAKSLLESLLYAAAALVGVDLAIEGAAAYPSSLNGLLTQAWPGILGAAVLAYFLVTLLGEAIPKALATREPERRLVRTAPVIRIFTLLFSPILAVTARVARTLAATAGAEPVLTTRAAHSEEEIKLLVEGSAEEGVLEEEEKEMIHSIIEFTETVARQVMVPRIDIHAVDADASLDAVVAEVLTSGHSRMPVYQGTLDTVVGIVHVKDLLPQLVRGARETPIRNLMREPFFVPEGKKIDELLQEFKAHKSQMAIVVDEFGGTSGLVTIEDVLEEIVGEIEDEYDQEEHPGALVQESGEGVLVDGRMTVQDLNEELCLDIPRGDYDTVGGFVFSLFGRPAEEGERVQHEGLEFVVEALDGLRIQRVRILKQSPGPPPAPDEDAALGR